MVVVCSLYVGLSLEGGAGGVAHVVYLMESVKDVLYVERGLAHSSVWEALQGGLGVSVVLRLFASLHLAQSGVPGMFLCAAFYCFFGCFCVFLSARWVLLLRVLSPCRLRVGADVRTEASVPFPPIMTTPRYTRERTLYCRSAVLFFAVCSLLSSSCQ